MELTDTESYLLKITKQLVAYRRERERLFQLIHDSYEGSWDMPVYYEEIEKINKEHSRLHEIAMGLYKSVRIQALNYITSVCSN